MQRSRSFRAGLIRSSCSVVIAAGLGIGAVALVVDAAPVGASVTQASDASWAKGACNAVAGWLGTVRSATTKVTSVGGDPAKAKKALDGMLRSSDAATAKLLKQLKAAGTPTTSGGTQLVPIAKDQFARVRQVIAAARASVAAAPTTDSATFARAVVAAQGGLESALEAVQSALGTATFADAPPLIGVFTASGPCQAAVAPSQSFGLTLSPVVATPGRNVSVAPAGFDAAGVAVCGQSSALKSELLDSDGARIAIGGLAVTVPADAKVGAATIRLVCYLPDQAGRRVIRGLCAGLVIGTGSSPSTTGACPATPRLVFAQGAISVESALSEGFNRLAT